MRKITLFIAIFMALLCTSSISATKVYSLNENFTTTPPTNWGFNAVSGHTFGYDAVNRIFTVRAGSPSSYSIKAFTSAIPQGIDNKITVELILKIYTNGNSTGAVSFYFRDSNGKPIFGLGINRGGTPAKYRLGRVSTYPGEVAPTAIPTNNNNVIDIDQPTAKVSLVLDMSAKTLSYDAIVGTFDFTSRIFSATSGSASGTDIAFIDATAGTDIGSVLTNFFRTSSSTGSIGYDIMYMGIATEQIVSTKSVTVNYLDPSNTTIKTARIATNNPVGSTYTALVDDKATISTGGFYYVYDATSTTADNVVVLEDGTAAINLKFTKSAAISGTYTWTGSSSANWNEIETNFSTDGSNSVGYQSGNAVTFNGTSANKSVTLNNTFDLGSNDVTISSDGFVLAGSGKLTGTGKVILNTITGEVATLNLTNELTGGVEVNGGIAVIAKDAAATKLTAANGSTLNLSTGSAFSKAITATGTINIVPTSNVWYTSAITGGTSLQYNIVSTGSVSTSAFSSLPILNNTFGGDIHVGTTEASAYFGTTISYPSNKLALGDNISLVYPQNPAADGSTTITIGELTGTSLSKLMGNRIGRTVTYTIGGLNTDFTFAGTVENFGPDAWAGIPITNLSKVGTGTMTLTGNSNAYTKGSVTVSAGKLVVNGSLGTTDVPMTVAVEGAISGTGTIAGATTVNGTLEGKLNFGSNLTLAGTTKVTVSGFEAGEFDVVKVTGTVNLGGVLEIAVSASAPANGTSIKIIDAAVYAGDFTQPITAPTGYTFDKATGMLTYSSTTAAENTSNQNLKVYTANNNAIIEGLNSGDSYIIYNTLGTIVKSGIATSSKVEVKLAASGIYLVKTGNQIFKVSK